MKSPNLKSTEILKRKFSTKLSGYSANEVDSFLDIILEDYINYEEMIKIKDETINDYKKTAGDRLNNNKQLKLEIENLKDQMENLSKTTEIGMHDRLQRLEKNMGKKKK